MVKRKVVGYGEKRARSGMTPQQLQQKVQEFLSSRKNANNIMDIMDLWDESDPSYILAMEEIFMEVFKRNDMHFAKSVSLTESEPTPETTYKIWLKERYEEVWEKLLSIIKTGELSLQQQALSTCFKLMTEEGKNPIESTEKFTYYFPVIRLKSILEHLLSSDRDNTELISKFQEISCYKDVLYFAWHWVPSLAPRTAENGTLTMNLLELVDKIPLSCVNGVYKFTEDNNGLLCQSEINSDDFAWDETRIDRTKAGIKKLCHRIVKWEKSSEIHKKSLIVLLERLLKHLDKPLFLVDFLWNSLDVGGPISLLALEGVAVLVTKHNVDYPKIFDKLYSMLVPEIFYTRYKPRLLHLCETFFQSKYVSESLAAAFVKRLARLTLLVSADNIITILRLICNLMLRHSGLERLVHHPQGVDVVVDRELAGDPFLMEEKDPLQSRAQLSSLWEIRKLEHHELPSVATAARFIRNPLPSVEYDLSLTWDKTYGQIFHREIKKHSDEIALSYERPVSGTVPRTEKLVNHWDFS